MGMKLMGAYTNSWNWNSCDPSFDTLPDIMQQWLEDWTPDKVTLRNTPKI